MFQITILAALACVATHRCVFGQAVRWVQTKTAVSPAGREWSAMVFDTQHRQIVLFGGRAGSYLADTWTLEGNIWTLKKPNRSPHARRGHAMAYDQARREVVLFAGDGPPQRVDTWIWDGVNWAERTTTTRPSSLAEHAMAYDALRQRTVLFGGSGSKILSETWEWDGKTWSQSKPSSAPPARAGSAMAYDSVRKEIVLFGGSTVAGKKLADTWTWDGKRWKQKAPTSSPSGRSGHAMAFDQEQKVIVLFGGQPGGYGSKRLNDTWTWDGRTWTQLVRTPTLGARIHSSMTYDVGRKEIVLFGGLASPVSLGDTWKLLTYRAALAKQYGAGCGTFPGVRLAPATGSLPVLGEWFTMQVLGLPRATTAGLLTLGLSKSRFGPVNLPLDLSSLGMKGCHLYNSFDIQFVFPISHGLGSYAIRVPYMGALKGSRAFFQAFGSDRIANKLGLVSSNGLEIVIGYR